MKYWIEKTIVKGRKDRLVGDRALGKALWSPRRGSNGADIYKNMRRVEPGDVVIHLVDNKEISGISLAKTQAIETTGLPGTEWEGPAYLVELEGYRELQPAISRKDIFNKENSSVLDEIRKDSEVFYNNKLDLRQGAYLTPCPTNLISLLNNIFNTLSHIDLPYIDITHLSDVDKRKMTSFNNYHFINSLKDSGLFFSNLLITRLVASMLTKPFVILTGLSGSGKTRLAQAFVHWISQDESQYCLTPVGADWTNREPLLGYPNALKPEEYVKPDNGVLDLIIHALNQSHLPHFLILDEMNLSHVERYFADFLSVMESKEQIPLHAQGDDQKTFRLK